MAKGSNFSDLLHPPLLRQITDYQAVRAEAAAGNPSAAAKIKENYLYNFQHVTAEDYYHLDYQVMASGCEYIFYLKSSL